MESYDLSRLQHTLTRHEGSRAKPYTCTEGFLTVGIGHNMEAKPLPHQMVASIIERAGGLTDEEISEVFALDIPESETAVNAVSTTYGVDWQILSPLRQEVLINMAFNLGQKRLAGFQKMWAALKAGDYKEAAKQMLDSKWAGQVGPRAPELASWMEKG